MLLAELGLEILGDSAYDIEPRLMAEPLEVWALRWAR